MKVYLMILVSFIFSCKLKNESHVASGTTNQYAKGFSITNFGSYKKVEIFNPWENARNIKMDYYLVGKDHSIPDSLEGRKIIRTPVKKVICTSTSHIAFLDAIDETGAIEGISGGNYITNQKVKSAFENGKIADIGYGQNLNYELIISAKPDLVMVYGIGSEVSGFVKKLEDLGVGVMLFAEYLEPLPLGKTEWLKLVGTLFNKEAQADSFFQNIETDYLLLKETIRHRGKKPKILVGIPYRDSWWVPGGNSYIANLIADAGGDYQGRENSGHESYVISFEDAMIWAETSDIWINTGSLNSKKEILDADTRFSRFKVFNKGLIYNNNRLVTDSGGIDFWESGTIYPNRILSDLIRIFYPGSLPDREFSYYKETR